MKEKNHFFKKKDKKKQKIQNMDLATKNLTFLFSKKDINTGNLPQDKKTKN